MNTYMSVRITDYGNGRREGYIFINVDNCKLEVAHRLSYEAALKEMAKLAKLLNKTPTMTINWYNPTISYRELDGYLD